MAKDKMQVVFNEENIKRILFDNLSKAYVNVSDKNTDIIVYNKNTDIIIMEFPDNAENNERKSKIEKDIHVWLSGLPVKNKINQSVKELYESDGEIQPEKLRDSIIGILSASRNGSIFICEKVIGNGRSSANVSKYFLYVMVRLGESVSGYKEMVEYIAETIKEKLNYTGDFLDMSKSELGKQQLFGGFQKRWILLGNFVEYYMKKAGLPDPEILTKLSATRYEGSESEARIYFTDKTIDTVEEFPVAGKEDREIKEKNLRMIRKLMEISKRDILHLYAEGDEQNTSHIISKLVRYNKEWDEDTYVKFSGFMHWSLFEEKREVFEYYHGEYTVNASGEDQDYIDKIKKLKGVDVKMTESLVEILREQHHGTSVIIFDEKTDVEGEVNRLCEMKRGIRIASNICYDEKDGWNKDQILSVTGIDGALFMDHKGRCLAIGVIVDGKTVLEGDVGRGARYNSIANYMKVNPRCVGIVISEDRMVNVIQNPKAPAASVAKK